MLSLAELRRVRDVVASRLAGHVVERFVQPDGERVAVLLYGREDGEAGKRCLLLVASPELARVSALDAPPGAPDRPPAFVSYLRAHLARARLLGARLIGDDRLLALRFSAKEGEYELVLAVQGKRSNLYVLDAGGVIVAALRPPAETRPEMALGAVFAPPASGLPRAGEDRFAGTPDPELLAAIERAYAGREETRDADALAREIRRVLRRERKSAEKRLASLEAELAEADETTTLQRHGELLKTALGRIEPGAAEVRVRDFATGEEVAIPLDPARSAKENLEAIFKRYQKLVRRLSQAGGQIDGARAHVEKLSALEAELDAIAPDSAPAPSAAQDDSADRGSGAAGRAAALAALAERPEIARALGRRAALGKGGAAVAAVAGAAKEAAPVPARLREVPPRLWPRRYRSRDGLEIWVGRNDAGNDYLTTKLAHGNDLFFHLDGAPGSHVILRTEGRTDPPHESVLDACELAVHFSKQKNAGRVDVHVVPIKQVKKPKGAKPGLVWVTGGRTVHLRREEARLARVLGARIDG